MDHDELAMSEDRTMAQSCLVTNGSACGIEWDMQRRVPEPWLVARAGGIERMDGA